MHISKQSIMIQLHMFIVFFLMGITRILNIFIDKNTMSYIQFLPYLYALVVFIYVLATRNKAVIGLKVPENSIKITKNILYAFIILFVVAIIIETNESKDSVRFLIGITLSVVALAGAFYQVITLRSANKIT